MKYYYNPLKIFLLVVILLLMYHQIKNTDGLDALLLAYRLNGFSGNAWLLGFCIALMPVNWIFESIKWKYLMSPHIHINFSNALKTVLAGVGAGIMTPARLGEYGGRLITSDSNLKTQVVTATLLGSIAQNLCNISVGLGFSYFFLKSVFGVTYGQGVAFSIVISIQILMMIWLYYNLPKIAFLIEKYFRSKYAGKVHRQLKSLDLYKRILLHKVLLISFLRYNIYFLQYCLIIGYLGISVDMLTLFSNISGIYLIQTGIPLPGFLSVLARGELAILVWSTAGIDSMLALVATFGLWFINLIVPALVGVVVLFRTDLKKYFTRK